MDPIDELIAHACRRWADTRSPACRKHRPGLPFRDRQAMIGTVLQRRYGCLPKTYSRVIVNTNYPHDEKVAMIGEGPWWADAEAWLQARLDRIVLRVQGESIAWPGHVFHELCEEQGIHPKIATHYLLYVENKGRQSQRCRKVTCPHSKAQSREGDILIAMRDMMTIETVARWKTAWGQLWGWEPGTIHRAGNQPLRTAFQGRQERRGH